MGLYMNINRQVIQEVYFGKTPGIEKCFEQFCKFRDKYISSSVVRYNVSINNDPDLIQFNRCMEEEFGFGNYALYVANSNTVNAFTIPISGRWDIEKPKKLLVSSRTGFKYKKEANLACITCIYTGLLFREDFTNGEIFAMLLHEIGHNFQNALSKPVSDIGLVSTMISVIATILNILLNPSSAGQNISDLAQYGLLTNNTVMTAINKASATINKSKILSTGIGAFMVVKGLAKDIYHTMLGPLNDFMTIITAPFAALGALSPINWPSLISGYGGEVLSDSFATIYGYGPELSSAFIKFDTTKGMGIGYYNEIVDRIPIVAHMRNLVMAPAELLHTMADEHPTNTGRIHNNIKALETELKKESLDPKMKKRITQDILDIKKSLNEFEDSLHDVPMEHHKLFSGLIGMSMYKSCGGDIRNDIIEPMLSTSYEIDSAYKDTLPVNNVKFK